MSLSTTRVDKVLTQIAKGYTAKNHINELILPPMKVRERSALIGNFGADGLRIINTIKSPEGGTAAVQTIVSKASAYLIEDHAIKSVASDVAKANAENPFDVERDATILVTDIISTGKEYGLGSLMNNYTNFATGFKTEKSGTAQWGGATADAISDITTAINTVSDYCGCAPNELTVTMSHKAWNVLRTLDDVLDKAGVKYTKGGFITQQMFSDIFDGVNLVIARSKYNNSVLGGTTSIEDIFGKHCWVTRSQAVSSPQLQESFFGFTPTLVGFEKTVDKWYENDVKGTWVRCSESFDQWVMDNKAGYMIKDVVA